METLPSLLESLPFDLRKLERVEVVYSRKMSL